MTTHALLIGARGRGHIERIRESTFAQNERFVSKIAPNSLVLSGKTTEFDFLKANTIRNGVPTTVLIEDIDGVTNQCVEELVAEVLVWSTNNSELPVTFYWDIIGLAPERTVELIEKLLPLVMLG